MEKAVSLRNYPPHSFRLVALLQCFVMRTFGGGAILYVWNSLIHCRIFNIQGSRHSMPVAPPIIMTFPTPIPIPNNPRLEEIPPPVENHWEVRFTYIFF